MMSFPRKAAFPSLLFLSLILECSLLVQKPLCAHSVVQVQLRGLKSVYVVTFVDNDIPGYNEIQKQIHTIAEKMLGSAGISLNGEQGTTISITANLYPIKDKLFSDWNIVQIRTVLREKVSLTRDISLRIPDGAITWERKWVILKRHSDLEPGILEEVRDQIESFCADLPDVAR